MSTSNAFLRKIARAPVPLCRKARTNEKKIIHRQVVEYTQCSYDYIRQRKTTTTTTTKPLSPEQVGVG